MVPLRGIVETALYTRDLEGARDFYQKVFDFPEINREGDRLIALAVAPRQVLLLFACNQSVQPSDTPGGRIPAHDGSGTLHLAFGIENSTLPLWREQLHRLRVPIESEVDCPSGGHSIYFRDLDSHLVELITPGCWSNDQ